MDFCLGDLRTTEHSSINRHENREEERKVSSHVATREKHSEGDLARTELCLSLGSIGAVLDSFFKRLKEKACLTLASENSGSQGLVGQGSYGSEVSSERSQA